MLNTLKITLSILIVLIAFNCKSTKNVVASGEANSKLSAKQVIAEHQKKDVNFKTLQGKVKIKLIKGDKEQGATFTYRMEKDKTIWLNAPLGLARMMITPDNVSFYNKQDDTYFDGDYKLLSDFVGVDLDFNKVQNILLGQAVYDLKNQGHKVNVHENTYLLEPRRQKKDLELFYMINPSHYKMEKFELSQQKERRFFQVNYNSYQDVKNQVFPKFIKVIAVEDADQVGVTLDFKSVTLNEKVRFPFKIPSGYKEIKL